MPFARIGVLASLTLPLARVGVGLFAFSTFDPDYMLVTNADFPKPVATLRKAAIVVEQAEA